MTCIREEEVKFVKCLKHCIPHMIVKWVNLGPFMVCDELGSRYSWPSYSPAADRPCELEHCLDGI